MHSFHLKLTLIFSLKPFILYGFKNSILMTLQWVLSFNLKTDDIYFFKIHRLCLYLLSTWITNMFQKYCSQINGS